MSRPPPRPIPRARLWPRTEEAGVHGSARLGATAGMAVSGEDASGGRSEVWRFPEWRGRAAEPWRFARIPAKRSRHSGYCDTMESGVVRRQVRQIVQSQLNLGDFLP